MSAKQRRSMVLRAVVTEHVATNGPVSSKAVACSHVSGVSSATIRADMGVLECEGLVRQPHTSSGRIPTDAGYRRFVDDLDKADPDPECSRRIQQDLLDARDIEDAMERTVRALSRITGQAALVEYPEIPTSGVRRIEVVDLHSQRLLVLVVSPSGRVEEKVVDLPPGVLVTETQAREAGQLLTEATSGLTGSRARENLARLAQTPTQNPETGALIAALCAEAALNIMTPQRARMAVCGTPNLARSGISDLAPLLEAIEEQVALQRVLRERHVEPTNVSIGAENQDTNLAEVSIVSATYATGGALRVHVGVVGPTRMNYPRSLAAVQAVSSSLSRLLLDRPLCDPGSYSTGVREEN